MRHPLEIPGFRPILKNESGVQRSESHNHQNPFFVPRFSYYNGTQLHPPETLPKQQFAGLYLALICEPAVNDT